MNVVVLGAGGLLGRHVVEELESAKSPHSAKSVRGFDRNGCDVGSLEEVRRATEGAEVIVNCAGFTNVDGSETDPAGAYRANALGAENVARAGLERSAKVVHISTDFVFDGAIATGYDEFDVPRPLAVYGRSKWAGEQLFQRVGGRTFLLRVQALYGHGGANFSSKLRALIGARKVIKLDRERRVQPTWARSAARQIVHLVSTEAYGTYHVSCGGQATWADFARVVAGNLGVEPAWEEVATADLKAPAARPPNCLFLHRMLDLRGLNKMPDWKIALEEYLAEMAQKERSNAS